MEEEEDYYSSSTSLEGDDNDNDNDNNDDDEEEEVDYALVLSLMEATTTEQPEQEEEQPFIDHPYEELRRCLIQNETRTCIISERFFVDAYDNNDGSFDYLESSPLEGNSPSPWTLRQWNAIFTALILNSSVETVSIELMCCKAVDALDLFVDYIHTSRTLKNVVIQYASSEKDDDMDEDVPLVIPKKYRSKIDAILDAVRQNPCITHLSLGCLGSARSIRNLLANRNSSLVSFVLRLHNEYNMPSHKQAFAVSTGLMLNNSLLNIGLSVMNHLDIMVSGLSHAAQQDESNLESLHLWTQQPCSNGIFGTRVLEVIQHHRFVKKLVVGESQYLFHINMNGIQEDDDDKAMTTVAPFAHQGSQLRTVAVQVYNDDEEEYYAQDGSRLMSSMLQLAKGFQEIQDLTLRAENTANVPGVRPLLKQVLQETNSLQKLSLISIGPESDICAGLADGMRENKTLVKLVVRLFFLQATDICMILSSLLENQTLQYLDVYDNAHKGHTIGGGKFYNSDESQEICKRLSCLFRINKSLRHVAVPSLDLRGDHLMPLLLEGLGDNSIMLDLDATRCLVDDAGFNLLGQALMDEKRIPIEHILLPRRCNDSLAGLEQFIISIAQMRQVKTVDFALSFDRPTNSEDLDNILMLLLHVVQENKSICSFGNGLGKLEAGGAYFSPLAPEIKYYLKLNRFGRHVLDSSNVRPSLWPIILARMTKSVPADPNVLFFFIREYFVRNDYPLRAVSVGKRQGSPPRKRVKVVEEKENLKHGMYSAG